MTIVKNIRLGLLHIAVAMTFVLINGVLNRVMIHDLRLLASLTALLVILPYLFSPLQIAIGRFSDRNPIAGYRRTPYIAIGVVLCLAGTLLAPFAAFSMARGGWGIALAALAFGLWGFGYNLAVVAYLALASDLSSEAQRSRTISVMWFMMITSLIIINHISVSRAVEPFSEGRLIAVFAVVCGIALLLAAVGLVGLEPRTARPPAAAAPDGAKPADLLVNPQARLFFVYLVLMLAAILGQDILLEPFGAEAFGMGIRQTTQLTATWGGATLLALLGYGFWLSRRVSKRQGAAIGALLAIGGLALIGLSGALASQPLFVPGVALLGLGTGISTSSNLGLMLDMTTPAQAGLFIGAWSVADSLARGVGTLLGGIGRDVIAAATGSAVAGYTGVFFAEALILAISLALLAKLDVAAFRNERIGLTELVALANN